MSAEATDNSSTERLERIETENVGPKRTVTASTTGIWWTDPRTDRDGQVRVEIEYVPTDWVVYPDSLVSYLREFEETDVRPEPMAARIWDALASLLFDDPTVARTHLEIKLTAETPMDDYYITIGETAPDNQE